MEIRCGALDLRDACRIAAAAVGKGTNPVLHNLLFDARGDGLTVSGTNMEVFVSKLIPGDFDTGGKIAIRADLIQSILSRAEGEVILSQKDSSSNVGIHVGLAKYSIRTINPDEFPEAPEPGDTTFRAKSDDILTAIDRTAFATDRTSSRYALGLAIDVTGGRVTFVATDGRRMSATEVEAEDVAETNVIAVISTNSVRPIQALLKATSEADIAVSISENRISFHYELGSVTCMTMEGRFPKWRNVFPKDEPDAAFELTSAKLDRVIRDAAIVADRKMPKLRLSFTPDTDHAQLDTESESHSIGKASSSVTIEKGRFSGTLSELKLNPRYVTDWLDRIEPESIVQVEMHHDSQPLVMRSDKSLYAVMPIIDWE